MRQRNSRSSSGRGHRVRAEIDKQFRDLAHVKDRLSDAELEACAAALFLAHHDLDHYEQVERDVRRKLRQAADGDESRGRPTG